MAEAICALYLRARRLRDSGRDDVAVLTEAARLQNSSVFRCPAALQLPAIDPATLGEQGEAPSAPSGMGARHP